MKRIILAALAFTVTAVPLAQAQSGHTFRRDEPRIERRDDQRVDRHRPGAKQQAAPGAKNGHSYHRDDRRPRWTKGRKVPNWQRQQHVRDWHRHGLRRPAPGQQWIRVGNDYLLVSVMSGLLLGMLAGR